MNIQEYISSGIVESYVLGLASTEEQLEFEQLCTTYAELRQAKEAFEISLEQHALDNAIAPPVALKQKIWEEVNPPKNTLRAVVDAPLENEPLTPVRAINFSKMLAAASVILLVGSTLLNFMFYNKYKASVARLDELVASNQQMAANNNTMQTRLDLYQKSLAIVKDSNTAIIAMKGQPVAPQSLTTVYWNKQTKDVYLLVNDLPTPVAGKQYQLWAIVDGVPVDAGMLNVNDARDGLVKMSNIPRAQAFAITLENTGGSKTPTMPIYVVGKT